MRGKPLLQCYCLLAVHGVDKARLLINNRLIVNRLLGALRKSLLPPWPGEEVNEWWVEKSISIRIYSELRSRASTIQPDLARHQKRDHSSRSLFDNLDKLSADRQELACYHTGPLSKAVELNRCCSPSHSIIYSTQLNPQRITPLPPCPPILVSRHLMARQSPTRIK